MPPNSADAVSTSLLGTGEPLKHDVDQMHPDGSNVSDRLDKALVSIEELPLDYAVDETAHSWARRIFMYRAPPIGGAFKRGGLKPRGWKSKHFMGHIVGAPPKAAPAPGEGLSREGGRVLNNFFGPAYAAGGESPSAKSVGGGARNLFRGVETRTKDTITR